MLAGFRANLDAWRQGSATQDQVEAALVQELSSDPRLSPMVRALIEAYRRAGHIPVPFAERLLNLEIGRPAAGNGTFAVRGPAGVGTVLANQYTLQEIVPGGDSGGMGVVYKAKDLIQEEALDRNPFVAIKIFNEKFKSHPESMTALHQEYKKALKLSHPNIVKLQNFNRDGSDVFIVMELLEGRSLEAVSTAGSEQRVARDEAMRIILELCRALGYAHQLGIVHSDFKPNNAFLTHDGKVKVLDFGIARAIKRTESVSHGLAGRTGEWTHFDPKTDRVYTSVYASCEQIGGADPDPRDDVYALAIVAYELLTGRHPFDRHDAAQARQLGCRPRVVRGLSRRQWHALQTALSFTREQRPSNAKTFGEALTPRRFPLKLVASVIVAVAVVTAAAATFTATWLERRNADAIAAGLNSTEPGVGDTAVARLLRADDATREGVLSREGAKREVWGIFERQTGEVFDPQKQKFDYAHAQTILSRARSILPDYEPLGQYAEMLKRTRALELNGLHDRFEKALAERRLLPEEGAAALMPLRDAIAALDPADPALNDGRVPITFRDAAELALGKADLDRTTRLVRAGLGITPADPGLLDVADRMTHRRDKRQIAESVGDLQTAVGKLVDKDSSLADFRLRREELVRLHALAPTDHVLVLADARLQDLVQAQIAVDIEQKDAERAQSLLGEWQALLDTAFVHHELGDITTIIGDSRAKQLAADDARGALAALLEDPRATDDWVTKLHQVLTALAAAAPQDPAISAGYQRANRYLLASARSLRTASRFSEAERVLHTARSLGAPETDLRTEAEAITQARSLVEIDNKNKIQQAKLAAEKQRVLDLAAAGGAQLDTAYDLYAAMSKKLPAGDSWPAAPRAIADGYLMRARTDALKGQFAAARLAAQKIEALPLTEQTYRDQSVFFERLVDLQVRLQVGDIAAATAITDELRRLAPASYDDVEPQLAKTVSDRVHKLAAAHPEQASMLSREARALFPRQQFDSL